MPGTSRRRAWHGSGRIFASEMLILPTGLVTAGVLTRVLGAEDYGSFTVVATTVGWLQATANSMLARAANRTVALQADWRPAASEVMRLHLITGVVLGVTVLLFADVGARLLGQPAIATPLRLLAADLPLFALTSAYRVVFVGTGDHEARANGSAIRWLVRMAAVVAFVQAGWSIAGAVAGLLAATVAELLYARLRTGPLPVAPMGAERPLRRELLSLAMPVALAAICSRLLDRADLFLLAMMGSDRATLGHYGAAQNLTVASSLLSASLAPVVLATVIRCEREGDRAGATGIMDDALRAPWLMLPFVGLAAGAAPDIMRTVYGPDFIAAAQPFALLMAASAALLVVSMVTALLVAVDRPWLVLAVNVPMLLLLIAGAAWLIPQSGGTGAALASLTAATGGALIALVMGRRILDRPLPWRTMAIGMGLAATAWMGARHWPVHSTTAVIAKLSLAATLLVAALLVTREAHLSVLRQMAGWPARRDASPP